MARVRAQSQFRGYDRAHRWRRGVLAPFVDAGLAVCSRCGERIRAGSPWDLGHDDFDRSRYSGPEHAACNRATASRRGRRVSRAW